MNKPRFRLDWDDEEEWDEDEDDLEEGECPEPELEGVSFAPIFTGLLKADGSPILRHPVVVRMGFHPERNKLHVPTLDETYDDEDRIHGWVYE